MRFSQFLVAALAGLSLAAAANEPPAAAPAAPAAAAAPVKVINSTADHSKFKELQKDFKSGPEVTKACLSCHTEAARQMHKTKHWTWEWVNPENQQKLGKKNVINNFCTATTSNEKFCAACHAGYGMENAKTFDYTSEANVDCLVCHDTTGSYKKLPGLSGHPAYKEIEWPPKSGKTIKPVDLPKVAQNVGKTSRATCGACHFYGGGGDAVKHGDLDSSLKMPAKYLDVHMDAKGLNFSCATCHATKGHDIPGSRYTPTGKAEDTAHMRGKLNKGNAATCQSCHGSTPHKEKERLNTHTDKIACQTCHIPQFARAQPTKMFWDWSTAGKLTPEGKRMQIKDASGHHDKYDSNKGDFGYESDVVPTYAWINGKVKYTLLGDPVNTDGVTKINEYFGSAEDGQSRIWPLKVFKGKQPYDLETKSLLVPHTAVGYGETDDSGFWANYKWDAALKAGAEAAGQTFSGKFDFVKTEMSWPITHMVAPKADALTCTQCHSKSGRFGDITGVYIPRRDANGMLDLIGWLLAAATLAGVLIHGGLRTYLGRKG
ncbi:MAG: tetrathionate reductase family octaheme c-type cytochrome [Gammaproteobacteria bacterium]|nr:tetrathionate reductase family octaheme c-type cytochrome [Gammaproteobacteria bacterium]MBU1645440.1 tetrathionate reductase family octaheme c-type cytochrome [Gammaproteobacteria bacterium]MBU1971063.1 tetrathionate reductase family octaheme c-type cytochrome [Gammaproteobacteria bacterium]